MGIVDQLRQTQKGRLPYERETTGPKLQTLKSRQSNNKECSDDSGSPGTGGTTGLWPGKMSPSLAPFSITQQKAKLSPAEGKYTPDEKADVRIVRCVTSPEFGRSKRAIHKYEEKLENEARKLILQKKREFADHIFRVEHDMEQRLQNLEQRATHHETQLEEAETAKRKLRQEEIRRKEQEKKEKQEKLAKSASDLSHLSTKIQQEYTACKYRSLLSEAGTKALSLVKTLVAHMGTLKRDCQTSGEVEAEHFEQCRNILEKASEAYELVKTELGRKNLVSWDEEALKQYLVLQKKLQEIEESTKVLASTTELKKLKFDIQKAVNTPINAISAVSGDHLRDKLKRLLTLLSGQPVEVSGKTVSLSKHPQASVFCRNLIAKMIVKKGEEQVSSKHESAFAIAMVAVGLWRESPSLGDLFLAHFYAQCPYLVPYYAPKLQGQSDKDYFESRGYRYEGGQVENQEKFLKRMSGIVRLYFSILVSTPPRGKHPHGLEHAWAWVTRILNLTPEPDITATMLYDFLQVTGHAFMKEYRKQFIKLLWTLCKDIVPKLKEVSSPAGSGSLSRLQVLLENSVKGQGNIPVPEGFLEQRFWLS
ncbi:GLE1-like protein [Mya arenaria]|uniref:mRNA export factor GLE1 n=1 Tax=Mya arenaria TaxID=6604 RepID=A0ABY7DX83_MYAAR|nr:GLE1-like protein [Mya arenaria]